MITAALKSFGVLFSLNDERVKLWAMCGLAALSLNPIAEVYLFKTVAELLLIGELEKKVDFNLLLGAKLVFLGAIVYLLKYVSKVGKILVVNQLMTTLNSVGVSISRGSYGWIRMVYIELVNLIVSYFQLVLVLSYGIYLNLVYGFTLVGASLLCCGILAIFFSKEFMNQKKLRFNKRDRVVKKGASQVLSRVRSAELSGLCCNGVLMLLLVLLFVFIDFGYLEPFQALVFVFIIRFLGISTGGVAGSLMRIARGVACSEKSYWNMCSDLKFFYGK